MTCQVLSMGDSCLSVVFEETLSLAVNSQCVALAAELERRALPGVRDVAPGFHTVAVYFDPCLADRERSRRTCQHGIDARWVRGTGIRAERGSRGYGAAEGPDLASVAAFADCSGREVVRLHTEAVYRVYMLGFLPGFAYLGAVDRRIAMPRLDAPRLRVVAGSVGIAGVQTGIYPCDAPGGWRIIGRTSARLFDPALAEPALFRAGDRVKFAAV